MIQKTASIKMDVLRMPSQPFPADPTHATKTVFNIANLYVRLGDSQQSLLAGISFPDYNELGIPTTLSPVLLSLVTLFQFAENLPDRQAIESLRTRMDWKYALHLPMKHQGLDSAALREFRRWLSQNRNGHPVFERVLVRLVEFGLLKKSELPKLDTVYVLTIVSNLNDLEELIGGLESALEVLAAKKPEWLLTHTQSHWYERYNRVLSRIDLPHSQEEQIALAQAIGDDALYLLNSIAQSNDPTVADLPELRNLGQIWERQFTQTKGKAKWQIGETKSALGWQTLKPDYSE